MSVPNWSQIVHDLSPSLYRYFSARFNVKQAEDCVQETLVRLVQKTHSGLFDSQRGSLRMYAYGIAHYVKMEAHKAQQNHPTFISDEDSALGPGVDHASDPHSYLEQNRRIVALRKAMTQLSEAQQEVLQLYIDQELTLDEISTLLNIPLGTAKSHISRAKEKLKELLIQQGDD